jgi:hypothetical protein
MCGKYYVLYEAAVATVNTEFSETSMQTTTAATTTTTTTNYCNF